jgi:hypothetical protein
MATFPELPLLQPGDIVDGRRRYTLEENFYHYDGFVPVGFETDLISVPGWARSLVARDGLALAAALVHDWDYVNASPEFTRRQIDQRFLRNMRYSGIGLVLRYAIYRAVRIGAGATWRKHLANR